MSDLMKIKEYFLACVAAVINGGDVPALPEDVDAEKVYNLAVRNSAQALLYFANGQGNMLPDGVAVKLKKAYQAAMLREMSQQSELDKRYSVYASQRLSPESSIPEARDAIYGRYGRPCQKRGR